MLGRGSWMELMALFLLFVEDKYAENECLISLNGMVLLCLATVLCGYLSHPPRKLAVRHLFLPVLHTLHNLTICPLGVGVDSRDQESTRL